jgi:hypothetical protein
MYIRTIYNIFKVHGTVAKLSNHHAIITVGAIL